MYGIPDKSCSNNNSCGKFSTVYWYCNMFVVRRSQSWRAIASICNNNSSCIYWIEFLLFLCAGTIVLAHISSGTENPSFVWRSDSSYCIYFGICVILYTIKQIALYFIWCKKLNLSMFVVGIGFWVSNKVDQIDSEFAIKSFCQNLSSCINLHMIPFMFHTSIRYEVQEPQF